MLAEDILSFLAKYIPGYHTRNYLLTVSGGMDSMAMLKLFKTLGLNITVAHCNFNLRGAESDGDEAFVKQQCFEMAVPCHIKHFDILEEKKSQLEGTQLLARKLRYSWFEELRKEMGCHYICTAHHQRDNAETILYRFMHGAYPESMQGIKPIHDHVIRPMIGISYEEIIRYVELQEIPFRMDSSNLTLDYTRNQIRQIVLPALKQVFGAYSEPNMAGVSQIYASYFSFLKQQAENLLHPKGSWIEIDIPRLENTKGNAALLYEALKNYGFNWIQCEAICAELHREQGTVFENNDRTFNLFFTAKVLQLVPAFKTNFYEEFVFSDPWPNEGFTRIGTHRFTKICKEELLDFKAGVLYLDYECVAKKKLSVRCVDPHDVFTPLGMGGKKNLLDFMKDLKLTPAEKQYQQVFCVDEQVACVLGKRIDDAYKIKAETKYVLVLEEFESSKS